MIRKYILFLIPFFASYFVQAKDNACFDAGKGFESDVLYKSVLIFKDCNHRSADFFAGDNDSLFTPMASQWEDVLLKDQQCFFWLKFRLMNSSLHNQHIFYNAGPFASYVIYKLNDGVYTEVITSKEKNYQAVDVAAHDTIDLLVKHYFTSALVSPGFSPWLFDFYSRVEENPERYLYRDPDAFYYFMILFAGMAGMLALYLLISYFHLFDRSYLYYSLNIFCIVALVAFRLVNRADPSHDGRDLTVLFSVMLQILSHLFYFLFASHFLNLKDFLPALYRFFRYVVAFLIIYIIADVILFFIGDCIAIRMQMFFWVRILLIIIAFGSIIYAFRKPTILLRLFAIGTFLMVISATISFVLSYYSLIKNMGFLSIPFFYFLLGYLIDNLFFTICLGYKNRIEHRDRLKLEKELITQKSIARENSLKLIMETQEQERSRMAEDLHDELGSGLSTIRFLIESMKIKGQAVPPHDLHFISMKSAEIIDNMRQIIWAVNPEHDNLADLLFYMKRYCGEYLETNKTDWNFYMTDAVPSKSLPPGLRRNLFAILKEALHNIVKHSNATLADVKFEYQTDADGVLQCRLTISDNGKGISVDSISDSGNGLKNMRRRMKETGGSFSVFKNENTGKSGTIIELNFIIP